MSAFHSLAAQSVAAGPPTLAPPSFEGNNWLYVLNLFLFFAGTQLCTMFALKLTIDTLLCWVAPETAAPSEPWYSPASMAGRFPDHPRFARTAAFILRWVGPTKAPDHDDWKSPIMLWRRILFFWAAGFALRCFSEMQSLWRWYPLDPVGTGRGLALKRILDPMAFGIGGVGLAVALLSLPGITAQLRKEPFPVETWTSLPLLKRPGGVVLCCLGAAIAVVVCR